MFKDRAFQVKMVKEDNTPTAECHRFHYNPHEINTMIDVQVKNVALAVGGVIVASAAAKTLSAIAIHTAKTYIK